MEDEEAELRNPFPSPPSHYTKYTSHNLRLLSLLRQRAPDSSDANQHETLADQTDVPDWPLIQLEKPRVDWILEDPEPYYDVFGDRWFVRETRLFSCDNVSDSAGPLGQRKNTVFGRTWWPSTISCRSRRGYVTLPERISCLSTPYHSSQIGGLLCFLFYAHCCLRSPP